MGKKKVTKKGGIYDVFVPNSGKAGAEILIVGEAPGDKEEFEKKPFVGESGVILQNVLGRHGLSRDDVYLANLCNYRPVGNKFTNLIDSEQLAEGLLALGDYIESFRPRVIIALGNYPLTYLTGKYKITAYRGSILPCTFGSNGNEEIKVVPTFHPAYVFRDRTKYPTFDFDIGRAIGELKINGFQYPEYNFRIDPKGLEREEITQFLCDNKDITLIASDIETVKNSMHILCIGFAWSATDAVVFPWNSENFGYIQRIIESNRHRLGFHFGTFDTQQIYHNGIQCDEYGFDTYVAQHCLEPELPRTLAYLCSVYTRQIYYKAEGRSSIPSGDDEDVETGPVDQKAWSGKFDKNKLYAYNGTDCCVTWDIARQQKEELDARDMILRKETYEYEMSLLPMLSEVSRIGLLIDPERFNLIKKALIQEWTDKQTLLDREVERPINVNSHPAITNLLYNELKLPSRYHKGHLSANADKLVGLLAVCREKLDELKTESAKAEWSKRYIIIYLIKRVREVRKLLSSYIKARLSDQGRIRSTFKVGPETGRLASQKFVDGSGLNAQTFTRDSVDVRDDIRELVTEEMEAALVSTLTEEDEEDEDD